MEQAWETGKEEIRLCVICNILWSVRLIQKTNTDYSDICLSRLFSDTEVEVLTLKIENEVFQNTLEIESCDAHKVKTGWFILMADNPNSSHHPFFQLLKEERNKLQFKMNMMV